MMRVTRVLITLSILSVLISGPSVQIIDQANAECGGWPPTCCWQFLVAGTVTVTDKARITTDKLQKAGLFYDVQVDPKILDSFKKANFIGKPVSGFIILDERGMIGFVPTIRDHDKEKEIPHAQALNKANQEFEEYLQNRKS